MKKSWLLALALAVALWFLAPAAYRRWRSPGAPGASLAKSTVTTTEPPPAYIRSLRPAYPYSVIPGGAYSPQELRHANSKDDVVRAHYADFNVKDAWVVKLTTDRYQYVSYRLQNQIYWTARKLRIPQGEYLLTDGIHFARARCGNRLSEQPHAEISSLEPPPTLLSLPAFRPGLVSKLDLDQTPPLSVEGQTPADPAPQAAAFVPPNSATKVLLEQSPELQAATPSVPVGPPPFLVITPGTSAATPSHSGGTPNQPPPEDPPNGPPAPPATPSPVPEPASIYLFLITFAAVLWGLTRAMAAEEKPDAETPKASFTDDLD
jgi:hypothetical protein